ncbi:hypothetical protein HOY82DRAFT_484648, partial [Tuber indicum]
TPRRALFSYFLLSSALNGLEFIWYLLLFIRFPFDPHSYSLVFFFPSYRTCYHGKFSQSHTWAMITSRRD